MPLNIFFLILFSVVRVSLIKIELLSSTQSPRAGHCGCFRFFCIINNMRTTEALYYSCRENIHGVVFIPVSTFLTPLKVRDFLVIFGYLTW